MKIAAIDIGSNSVHMVVAQVLAAGGLDVIDKEKDFVRLGDGVFETGKLKPERMKAALRSLQRYADLARSFDAKHVVAVATSATRDAENGRDFIRALRRKTNLDARIISGEEEARLIYLAAVESIDVGDRRALVIDIGGGSLELALGQGKRVAIAESLPLGVRRVRDTVGAPGKLSAKVTQRIERRVDEVARKVIDRIIEHGFDLVIGTSGSISALGEILAKSDAGWSTINAEIAPLKRIEELTKTLSEHSEEDRVAQDDVEERRADTIHLGAVVLTHLMRRLGADELTFCSASLREGVMRDYLQRTADEASLVTSGSLQRRSVYELGRQYGADLVRLRQVRELALEIFDRTQPIHEEGKKARALLEFAAELHRVGHFVSYKRNHKHARYLIRHARMAGFTNDETRLLSLIVRFHRKSEPAKRHRRFKKRSKSERRLIRLLAGILRVAIALDRKGSQSVTSAICEVKKRRVEVIVSGHDVEHEVFAARAQRGLLERALGREVDFRVGIQTSS